VPKCPKLCRLATGKSFSGTAGNLSRGIGRKFSAGDVPDGLGDALSRTGRKSGIYLSERQKGTGNISDQYSMEMIGYLQICDR
jgi:hypothetical protein